MVKKSEDVKKAIVAYMKKQEWPSTTEDTAAGVGVSWQTAQVHLLKLVNEGVLKYRKVGRQNQFWLVNKYRKEFE